MDGKPIEFFVAGIPRPGGSKRAFYNANLKRAMIVDANDKVKPWREDVRNAAQQAYHGPPLDGALTLTITFTMPRPAKHYMANDRTRPLRADAPYWHTSQPDATKLTRAVEDALKGLTWRDDAQVAAQHVTKVYGDRPGARVLIVESIRYLVAEACRNARDPEDGIVYFNGAGSSDDLPGCGGGGGGFTTGFEIRNGAT